MGMNLSCTLHAMYTIVHNLMIIPFPYKRVHSVYTSDTYVTVMTTSFNKTSVYDRNLLILLSELQHIISLSTEILKWKRTPNQIELSL